MIAQTYHIACINKTAHRQGHRNTDMTDFTLHDETTAPGDSKALLASSKKAYGMIPGLHGVMAEAPELLEAYQTVHQLFSNSSFDKDELTVV